MYNPRSYYDSSRFYPIVKISGERYYQYCGSKAKQEHMMRHYGELDWDTIEYSCGCDGWHAYKQAWKAHCDLKNEVVPKMEALYEELEKQHTRLSNAEILYQEEIRRVKVKYGVK